MKTLDVKSLLANVLNLDRNSIHEDTTAADFPEQWDSLNVVNVVIAIEQAASIRVRREDMPRLTSVKDLHQVLGEYGVRTA